MKFVCPPQAGNKMKQVFLKSEAARRGLFLLAAALVLIAVPRKSFAQTDEIQVYDAEIAEPGVVNLMWHQNFTPDGIKTPAFPGAIISDKFYKRGSQEETQLHRREFFLLPSRRDRARSVLSCRAMDSGCWAL